MIEAEGIKQNIEEAKKVADEKLKLQDRVDARLRRHQEAHSADLLKPHFKKERRLDLQEKVLKHTNTLIFGR